MFKQEAHGPHRSPEFKSINTYDYNITLIKKRKKNIIYFIIIYCFFIWRNLNPPHLCQVWLKLAQWFWRRRFLNFVNVFSLLHNYLPMEKDWDLHLNKPESLSPKDALCQVWLKLAQWRRRFWNFINVFSLFHDYLPLVKCRALYLNKLESPSPKDALVKIGQVVLKKKIF